MYPLANWTSLPRGYKFKQRTWYSRYHLGLDVIAPTWTPIYAPFNGYIVASGKTATQGNFIHYRANHDRDKLVRFMHLARANKGIGKANEGEIIGYVGSTGMSTGSHLHIDISNPPHDINNINLFVDPETYNWNQTSPENPTVSPFRVIVVKPAYVRSQPQLSAPLSGSRMLNKGDTFDGVAIVAGDSINGNNQWVKSAKGNYVWSGNLRY